MAGLGIQRCQLAWSTGREDHARRHRCSDGPTAVSIGGPDAWMPLPAPISHQLWGIPNPSGMPHTGAHVALRRAVQPTLRSQPPTPQNPHPNHEPPPMPLTHNSYDSIWHALREISRDIDAWEAVHMAFVFLPATIASFYLQTHQILVFSLVATCLAVLWPLL